MKNDINTRQTERLFVKKTGVRGGKSAEFLYEKEKIMLAFYVNSFYTKTKWGKVERNPLNVE